LQSSQSICRIQLTVNNLLVSVRRLSFLVDLAANQHTYNNENSENNDTTDNRPYLPPDHL
jgi:hypothetical protein